MFHAVAKLVTFRDWLTEILQLLWQHQRSHMTQKTKNPFYINGSFCTNHVI